MAECILGNSRIYFKNEHARVPFFAIHVIMWHPSDVNAEAVFVVVGQGYQ